MHHLSIFLCDISVKANQMTFGQLDTNHKGIFKLIRTIAYPHPGKQEEKTTVEESHNNLIYPFRG